MRLLLFILVVTLLVGCAAPPTRPSPSPTVAAQPALGRPIVLAVGQSTTLSDAPVKITLDGIGEDSRCPKQVDCVWSGRAVLDLTAQIDASAPVAFALSTIGGSDKTDRATLDGYEIILASVQPYPETPDNPIKREDYRAEFIIQRIPTP